MPGLKNIQRKVFTPKDLKFDIEGKEGTFRAVFATLNVIDRHQDMTINGAFGTQNVVISQYNHGSWESGAKALPIGIGTISEQEDEAIVFGEFDMDDPDAVKTYKKIKYLNEKGRKQEWSYALPEIDSEMREINGVRVRVLKKIEVPEVSPVLMGAGVDTRLLDIKSGKSGNDTDNHDTEPQDQNKDAKSMKYHDHAKMVLENVTEFVKRSRSIASLRKEKGETAVSENNLEPLKSISDGLSEAVSEIGRLLDDGKKAREEALRLVTRFETMKIIGGK